MPKYSSSFINLALVPSTFLIGIRFFMKEWLITGLTIFMVVYVITLLLFNIKHICIEKNKAKRKKTQYRFIEKIVGQMYRTGMIIIVAFFVSRLFPITINALLPSNQSQNSKINLNECKLDWKEMKKAFSQSEWEKMGMSQKISWLQKITDYTAETYLGCNTLTVEVVPLGENLAGCYLDTLSDDTIYISYSVVDKGAAYDAVFCVIHELYHHYEYCCISEINFESNSISELKYFEKVKEWKDNSENYIEASEEGYDAYEDQPLEKSANEFAENLTDIYFDKVK